ncbi:MAG: hypothetical protein ACMX3H_10415 [Sodalis sp. (in: enterobacteria)]|uniref:hypothetical protein n=1 Tax=Sodalis sp. (in: enterobacteria) TaxID=1898979 RepID=UPI0039E4D0A6
MEDENFATIKPCSKPVAPSDYDEWSDALEWLDKNVVDFPTAIENDIKNHASRRIFKNWRFVEALDGEIIFANGLIPCVDMNDLKKYREFNKKWQMM